MIRETAAPAVSRAIPALDSLVELPAGRYTLGQPGERGYPQLTVQAKRKILGENMPARHRRRGEEGGAGHRRLTAESAPATAGALPVLRLRS